MLCGHIGTFNVKLPLFACSISSRASASTSTGTALQGCMELAEDHVVRGPFWDGRVRHGNRSLSFPIGKVIHIPI